jgi:hypothetical protein
MKVKVKVKEQKNATDSHIKLCQRATTKDAPGANSLSNEQLNSG